MAVSRRRAYTNISDAIDLGGTLQCLNRQIMVVLPALAYV